MRHSILFPFVLTLLVSSCKKSDDSNATTSPVGKKLVKDFITDGQYSATSIYFYDPNGRLAAIQQEITGNGRVTRQGMRVTRNSAGMIEKIRFVDDGSRGDTISINVTSSGPQYTSAESNTTRNPGIFSTRTNFVYDNSGHIVQVKTLYDVSGRPYGNIDELTYQSNNVTTVKTYSVNNGTNTLFSTEEYAYDNKNNPLPFGNEWILFSLTYYRFYEVASVNNAVKVSRKQAGTAEQSSTINYSYNEQNLPVKGSYSTQPSITRTFTYE